MAERSYSDEWYLPKVPYSNTTGSIIRTGVWQSAIQLISEHMNTCSQ